MAAALKVVQAAYERVMDGTHPVQRYAIGGMIAANVAGLVLLNQVKGAQKARRRKGEKHTPPPWPQRRLAYWATVSSLVGASVYLDTHYSIGELAVAVKAYAFAFPMGLLDLHFSSTGGVAVLSAVPGAILWCASAVLRQMLARKYFPQLPGRVMVTLPSLATPRGAVDELLRYATLLMGSGLFADLVFSPVHRLMHKEVAYAGSHSTHHEFTDDLTSLVLYHGEYFDDFLMPVASALGSFCFEWLLNELYPGRSARSNLTAYVTVFSTLLSHAHDFRASRLLAPVPKDLNHVRYHYVHHLLPNKNFGLTKPSDLIWDALLGVDTIGDLDAIAQYDGDDPAQRAEADFVRQAIGHREDVLGKQ